MQELTKPTKDELRAIKSKAQRLRRAAAAQGITDEIEIIKTIGIIERMKAAERSILYEAEK